MIGVFTYSTIYLLMCGYLTLHLAISILDNSSMLRRNPVCIFCTLKLYALLFKFIANNDFQFIIKFIGPQIGDNFSQHQETNFTPPR